MAQASMRTNRKVRDIADHLVHTGELVGAPPPGTGGGSGRGAGPEGSRPGAPHHL
jgi:hypothetical protein